MTSTVRPLEGTPTRAELVARAVALQPLLRAHAAEGDLNRRQPDEVIGALTSAGFFRLLKPTRFGGQPTDFRTVVEVTQALGAADGSAAWLVGLAATAAWVAGLSSPRAQQEMFGSDPDARISGGIAPASARRVDGGLVVTGRWPYASGSPHATWGAVGAAVVDGQQVDAYLCLVPASHLRLEDTWHVVGMRGTGSNTWVADNLFIPDHRLISMSAMIGSAGDAELQPREFFAGPATLSLVGPLLGLGNAALSAVIADAPIKAIRETVFEHQSDSVGVQLQVGQAALALKTAQLHAYHVADTLDESQASGKALSYPERAEIRGACGYAAQQVLEAIHLLLNVHGAGSFAESNPLQRYWRDANTAARHAGLNATVGREVYGKALLGVDERITQMV